jgi:ubiquinone/menaquinone biosynthesis C-methylase UbiE
MKNSLKQHTRDMGKRLLPTRLRANFPYSLAGRKIGDFLQDRAKQRLFGSLAPLVPRIADMFDGPRNLKSFKADGEEFLRIYKDVCGLERGEKMLDVGCGIGRKTIPLTYYLNSDAVYEGIDLNKKGTDWCNNKITTRFPNFRFQQIDVYNKFYNPRGKVHPTDYRFPYDDNYFDFIMLGSVFTHMFPEDAANYLSEVYRVLKQRGRCLITYFLLTQDSLRALAEGKSTMDFKHSSGNYRIVLPEMPEYAIAYDERWLRETYPQVGLKLARLDYGSWCGRTGSISYQDLALSVKE